MMFKSWFQAGFESSTLKFHDHRRIDVLSKGGHDRYARHDYALLASVGISTVRDGLRWHLIEPRSGRLDWSSWKPMLDAAEIEGMQVIWDLCHYGVPNWVNLESDEFPEVFAEFASQAALVLRDHTDQVPWWSPQNEISFWAYAAGDAQFMFPAKKGGGEALKRRLVRATILAMNACRAVDPHARFVQSDPLVRASDEKGQTHRAFEESVLAALDMQMGRLAPELGGGPQYLDVVGVNFYSNNQWRFSDGLPHGMGHLDFRAFYLLLQDIWSRYGRPILISETGAEADGGPGWLRYVSGEARMAMDAGVNIVGLCLYPGVDYPGWSDDRHCRVGMIECSADFEQRRLRPLMVDALCEVQMLHDLYDKRRRDHPDLEVLKAAQAPQDAGFAGSLRIQEAVGGG